MVQLLEEGHTDQLPDKITELRSMLRVTNRCKPRMSMAKGASVRVGGVQYTSECMLSAVLLTDNLKPLDNEKDLLPEVFQQYLCS